MKKYNITIDQHTEIKNREFTVVKFPINGKEYTCYSKVMQYLLTDSPVLINRETNSPEQVELGEVLDVYTIAYDKGREMFRTDIKPDASIDFLIEQYNDYYNGWKRTSEELSLILQKSQVERIGYAAGVRFEYEIYRQKKRAEFEAVEHKEKQQRLTVKGFKDKIPERLTEIHTYLSKNNLIDCNIDIWLYWFNQRELNHVPERIQWKGADTLLTVIIKEMCDNGGKKYIENAFKYKCKYQRQNDMYSKEKNKINDYMKVPFNKI